MGQLHIVLFPVMAHGHTIPMLDMAKLFISRGLKTTIIATAASADPINRAAQLGLDIGLSLIKFPPKGSSLPDYVVSLDQAMSLDMLPRFFEALALLQEPLEELLQELNPSCLVSDMFLPWTVDSAAKFGIPRLIFHGMSCFALCVREQLHLHKPYDSVESDSKPFAVPNLPHQLTFTRSQLSPMERGEEKSGVAELQEQVINSVRRSYGVVINSFYEIESGYADHYKNVLGRKAWHIGPLLLSSNWDASSQAYRGGKSAIDEHECLAWLDSKRPNSVVYVCHGSLATFTPSQLHETAVGLEASGQDFIWVVRKGRNEEEWVPEGFEERMKGKGVMVRGWAPQLMILNHRALGAFVTHCGWNSTVEGICAGIPMVTWPVFAEQFCNEKLVTEVLKIGVSVGNKKWQRKESEGVGAEAVAKAVKEIMVGEGAREMRSRAKYYREMARQAVEEGGSSYNSLDALIQELSAYTHPKKLH